MYSLSLIHISSNDSSVTGVQFINTRWLKNVGLEIPKTQDEFYAVLKAFKEKDANGNGDSNDEIPLEFCNNFWAGNIKDMFGYWGFTGYYNVEDGKVIPTMNTEDFKNALVFYNKLANEGLLDVEGFSQTREQFSSKVKQGKVGISLFWSPVEFISDDSALDYKFMPPFAANGYSGKPQLRGLSLIHIFALPLSKAIVAVIALYIAVNSWNSYFNPMIYLTDVNKYPLPILLREILITAKPSDTNAIVDDPAAAAKAATLVEVVKYGIIVVTTLPILCVYPFLQKYFVKDLLIKVK